MVGFFSERDKQAMVCRNIGARKEKTANEKGKRVAREKRANCLSANHPRCQSLKQKAQAQVGGFLIAFFVKMLLEDKLPTVDEPDHSPRHHEPMMRYLRFPLGT